MAEETDDQRIASAERDASPDRFPEPFGSFDPDGPAKPATGPDGAANERAESVSLTSSSSSSAGSLSRVATDRMSRVNTSRDVERHPTELSRIATHKSQHEGTVGRTLKSRESKKPLPSFGAGKPYPPMLPEQESYVVEFDGPDDPMHPQNWGMKKK